MHLGKILWSKVEGRLERLQDPRRGCHKGLDDRDDEIWV